MTHRDEFLSQLAALARDLMPSICEDYRASECECAGRFDDEHDADCLPSMQVTIGVDGAGWGFQTGDNSYSGGAYGFAHWGIAALYRDTDPYEFARAILEDLEGTCDDLSTRFFYDESNVRGARVAK